MQAPGIQGGGSSNRVCSLEAFPGLPAPWTLFSSHPPQGYPREPHVIGCPFLSRAITEGTPTLPLKEE